MLLPPNILALALLLPWPQLVRAAEFNRTIDDWFGDPVTGDKPGYQPDRRWTSEVCSGCAIKPDREKAFRGTWSETTYIPETGPVGISLRFHGTAVYVFFILANNQGPHVGTVTECKFILDAGTPVHFRHAPDMNTTELLYDQAVFVQTGLPNGPHTVQILADGDEGGYISFDYAIYTYDDSPPALSSDSVSPSSSSATSVPSAQSSGESKTTVPVGAIVGGVIGGVAFGAILLFLGLFICWRKRKGAAGKDVGATSNPMEHLEAHPYPISTSSQSRLGTMGALHGSMTGTSSSFYQSNPSGVQVPSATGSTFPTSTTDSQSAPRMSIISDPSAGSNGHGTFASSQALSPTTHALSPRQEKLRLARQAEIDRQLRTVESEMTRLGRDMQRGTSMRTPAGGTEADRLIAAMQEQMQSMQEQIRMLRENQNSDWAAGLTNDPPPGYTAEMGHVQQSGRRLLPPLPSPPVSDDQSMYTSQTVSDRKS